MQNRPKNPLKKAVDDPLVPLMSALCPDYTQHWSQAMKLQLRNTLTPGAPGPFAVETTITQLLESLSDAESAVVDRIWAASSTAAPGSDPVPAGARLYRLQDFLSRGTWSRPGDRSSLKLPDFIVAHPDLGDDSEPTKQRLIPDVAVEFKGSAKVNGRYGYCPDDVTGLNYSNQPICYAHGCWANLTDADNRRDFARMRFVWIGPDVQVGSQNGPWGTAGLSERDRGNYSSPAGVAIDPAIDLQNAAAKKWHGLGLSQLESTIRAVPGGSSHVADAISAWRARNGL